MKKPYLTTVAFKNLHFETEHEKMEYFPFFPSSMHFGSKNKTN